MEPWMRYIGRRAQRRPPDRNDKTAQEVQQMTVSLGPLLFLPIVYGIIRISVKHGVLSALREWEEEKRNR